MMSSEIPPSPRTARVSALDRAMSDTRVVAVVGPAPGLTVDQVRQNLRSLLNQPGTRLSLTPDRTRRRWTRDVADPAALVTEMHGTDAAASLTSVRRQTREEIPLRVVLAGDHLIVDASHGLGDGRLFPDVLAALAVGHIEPLTIQRCTTSVASPQAPARILWQALLRHPRRIPQVLRVREANASQGATDRTGEQSAPAHPLIESPRVVLSTMPAAQVRRLADWASETYPDASAGGVSTLLYSRALARVGIAIADEYVMLADCRRYLPRGKRERHGNLAIALPMRFRNAPDPGAATRQVRNATGSGWPALILAAGEVKGLLRDVAGIPRRGGYHSGPGHDAALADAASPLGAPLRLAFSFVGECPQNSLIADALGLEGVRMTSYMDPDGAGAMTLCTTDTSGVRTVSASFHDSAVDPDLVQEALDAANTDPVGVLTTGPAV